VFIDCILSIELLSEEVHVDTEGKDASVVQAEKGRLESERNFKMSRELIMKLDADKIDQMKRYVHFLCHKYLTNSY
jgi:hypothetical protein